LWYSSELSRDVAVVQLSLSVMTELSDWVAFRIVQKATSRAAGVTTAEQRRV